MLVTRAYIGKLVTAFLSFVNTPISSTSSSGNDHQQLLLFSHDNSKKYIKQGLELELELGQEPPGLEYKYHLPPPGVKYETNPTIFGRILEGTQPAITLVEDEELISIEDKYPRAPLHALVIPKQYIKSINTLSGATSTSTAVTRTTATATHENYPLNLLTNMKQMAIATVQVSQPNAYKNGDYILCFHIPPFTSVKHLHLHVLAPASEMKVQYRWGKYLVGTPWCADLEDVIMNQMKMS